MRNLKNQSPSGRRFRNFLALSAIILAVLGPINLGPRISLTAEAQSGGSFMAYVLSRANSFCVEDDIIPSSVVAIDPATSRVQGNPIPVDCGAQRFTVSPNGQWLYVTSLGTDSVPAIHTGRKAVMTTIRVGMETQRASLVGIAITPDAARVLVAKLGGAFPAGVGAGISYINARSNTLSGQSLLTSGRPFEIAVTPDGKRAYSTTRDAVGILVVDLSTNAVIKTIPAGPQTWSMAMSPDGQRLFTVDRIENSLRVIDTATNMVTKTVDAGNQPNAVAISPDGSRLYIVHRGGQDGLWVMDSTNYQVITKIPTGADVTVDDPGRVAVSPDGTLAYVTNRNTNDVTAVDLKTNSVIRRIAVPTNPLGVVFGIRPTEVAEREPNDEMTQANAVSLASILVAKGAINRAGDVDFFSFDARAGQQLILDCDATVLGAQTDTVVTLLNSTGAVLAENNDFDGSRDSYLTFTIPSDGKYFVSVKSNNSRQGGANVIYETVITLR